MRSFLHIGCGEKRKAQTTLAFNTDGWSEVRFDIDPAVKPDVIGTMTDLSAIPDQSFDALFSSHNIEHLYPHEVGVALDGFVRILKPDGFLVVTCPDLRSICQLVADDKLTEPAYVAPSGPVSPLDVLYGFRPSMAAGNLYMAHRCGFTQKALIDTLRHHGFATVASSSRPHPFYDLWAIATVTQHSDELIHALAREHFPRPKA
jgi:ubiquinone/menaquinone biosynthesis C-methylase UbiE